jgi:hypothetical protein
VLSLPKNKNMASRISRLKQIMAERAKKNKNKNVKENNLPMIGWKITFRAVNAIAKIVNKIAVR